MRLENTHGTEFRELLYPWHPWFNIRVAVHEAIGRSDGIVFRCSLSGSATGRRLEIPVWMFDQWACARLRVAADAHADLAALTMLAALLRYALNDRCASSNALLSGASNFSRPESEERSMPRQTKQSRCDAARHSRSICSQENHRKRSAASRRGPCCRWRHKQR